MENKELSNDVLFINAILAGLKKELKDFAQIQRNLKKSRKLEFRPKDRSLQSIVDKINDNAYKIQHILFYYTWLKHGKKYWANRNIKSYWEYYTSSYNTIGGYSPSYENQTAWWIENDNKNGKPYTTYGEYTVWLLTEFLNDKLIQYDLEFDVDYNNFINK